MAKKDVVVTSGMGLAVEATTFKVVCDYSQTLSEMISAGKYDWVNGDITQDHFPVSGQGRHEVEVVLFHFGKLMTSDQVIAEMEKVGYRPVDLPELLGLGATQPELQKEFPVVAFGSVWWSPSCSRYVPCLRWSGVRRSLSLYWFDSDWDGHCRFAAVHK